MSRILIVEDSIDILESLQSNLETDGYEVFVATRVAQVLPLVSGQAPDLIILDVELPDGDGFTALQELRARGSSCPVLMLTARSLETDKLLGFRLGADDYVTKPFSIMELLARISALLRRAGMPHSAAAVAGAGAARAPLTDDELRERFGLTPRQIDVARLVSQGLSNAEIAKQLELSYFTARNHIEQIILKLGVPNRAGVGAVVFGG
jgi:DNA-binding response OmpR family regulator